MRRLLSILLLAFLGLPMASPLLAMSRTDESSLPACCRRGGQHHCMIAGMHGHASSDAPSWTAPAERCPFAPASITAVHADHFSPSASEAIFAGIVSHPAIHAQTRAMHRISCNRSRSKRGPPFFALS